jgi:hypothetical protein
MPDPKEWEPKVIVCPICGRDDQVQKVNDLNARGTANASQFRSPAQPSLDMDTHIRWALTMGLILLGVVLSFLLGLATANALWFVASGLWAGLSVVVLPKYLSDRLHYQRPFGKRNAWRPTVQRRQGFYRCLRDDCVFDLKTGECVPSERLGGLASAASDMDATEATQREAEKPNPALRARPGHTGLPRTLVIGQVGILLISLGLTFTLAVFLSLNFSDPSRSEYANARQIIGVIGKALLVIGIILVGFLTVPFRDH